MATENNPGDVVAFWRKAGKEHWFKKDETFDAGFRDRFLAAHHAAARREHDDWSVQPEGTLALLILLDQFPRNAFRGSAHMFATDPLARLFARRALTDGHDSQVDDELRLFFYMPFMHSEELADQDRSMQLLQASGDTRHAVMHRDIIERFGRFPHRNPLLGRDTTAEEAAWLNSGGFAG